MWKIAKLSALNYQEIYQLFKLRTDVFVVEQNCAYPEIDEADLTCLHGLKLNQENQIMACFRLIEMENDTKIGRVVVAKGYRGQAVGDELLKVAIDHCRQDLPIIVEAQAHLTHYYGKHGFEVISEVFLEDGIPHVKMRRGEIAQQNS